MKNTRRTARAAFLISLCLLMPERFAAQNASSTTIAVHATHLIDVRSGNLVDDPVVLVESQRIKSIESKGAVVGAKQSFDLTKCTLLPGFIDAHTHLLMAYKSALGGDDVNMVQMLNTLSTADRVLLGALHAREYLEAGFTSIRDVGNSGEFGDVAVQDAILKNWIVGPRMRVSGKALAITGGQSGATQPAAQALIGTEYAIVESTEDAVKAIHTAAFNGSDLIKVIVDARNRTMPPAILQSIVTEAHRLKMKVAAHAVGEYAGDIAVAAGVDSVEHGYGLSDKTMKAMAEKHIFLVPTTWPELVMSQEYAALDESRRRPLLQRKISAQQAMLKRAMAAGVPIAFGSDMYYEIPQKTRGEAAALVFDEYRAAGMSPIEIIRSATIRAAELLGIDDRSGSLEPGKVADMIGVEGDPLKDPTALTRVRFVMAFGRVVRNEPCNQRPEVQKPD